MTGRRPRLDDESTHRLERIVVLVRRLSILITDAVEDAGLYALTDNREIQVATQLHQAGPQRPRDLQGPVGLTSGGLAKLLDRLVADGLVVRTERDLDGDGRGVAVELTRSGKKAVSTLLRTVDHAHDACRPLAKDIVAELEALGAGHDDPLPEPAGVMVCLTRVGEAIIDAVARTAPSDGMSSYLAVVLLSYIDLEGGGRPSAIMDLLGLSSGGVTKMVDRLVAEGLVTRHYGSLASDRRAVTVRITRKGRSGLQVALESFTPHLDELWTAMHWLADGA
jgi:DNA-binding MarR family transcriptional regulator